MKIKVHNFVAKTDNDGYFNFDNKIAIRLFRSPNRIHLLYRPSNVFYFIRFSCESKTFEEWAGFGNNEEEENIFDEFDWKWKEL